MLIQISIHKFCNLLKYYDFWLGSSLFRLQITQINSDNLNFGSIIHVFPIYNFQGSDTGGGRVKSVTGVLELVTSLSLPSPQKRIAGLKFPIFLSFILQKFDYIYSKGQLNTVVSIYSTQQHRYNASRLRYYQYSRTGLPIVVLMCKDLTFCQFFLSKETRKLMPNAKGYSRKAHHWNKIFNVLNITFPRT